MSLRTRLFLLTVVLFAAGLLAAGLVIPALVRDFLVERVDDDLPALRLAALGELRGVVPPVTADSSSGEPLIDLEGAYVQVYAESDGTLLLDAFLDDGEAERQRPDLPVLDASGLAALELDNPRTVTGTGQGEGVSYRVVASRPGELGVIVIAALPLSDVDAAVGRVVVIESVVGGAVLLLVAAVAWWSIGVGLAPLRHMEETAESIRSGRFEGAERKRRVPTPAARTELGRLGTTLNGMLDEIDEAFERQAASETRLRRFVADASHELRTPLTSIRGYAQLLRRQAGVDPAGSTSLARIESESRRMTSLVGDLLVLARFDEDPPLRVERVDLGALAAEAVADARAADPGRLLRAIVPAPSERAAVVVGDRAHLSQALLNLLANARAHTPPSTPVEVHVWAPRTTDSGQEPRVRLEVVDHGPGIDDGEKRRVFDRFARLDRSRSRHGGGAGLGLAIVAAIVAAHGGTVEVVDTPGGGATFAFELPAA